MERDKEQGLASAVHILGYFTSFLAPLIVYLMKNENGGFAADQAREALNFQITVAIAMFASFMLMIVLIGFLFILVVAVIGIACCVIAAVRASRGERYRYPLSIRFIPE